MGGRGRGNIGKKERKERKGDERSKEEERINEEWEW